MKSQPPLQIGTPCPKRWNTMQGDAKRRFCGHCQLHVHNLSAMSARERKRFIATSGGHACIAYELRPDGSMVTPSRWSRLLLPFQRLRASIAALLAAFLPFFVPACESRRVLGESSPPCGSHTKQAGDDESTMMLGTPMVSPPPKSKP